MLIDAHHHLWDPARGDYGWLEAGTPLCRPFTPGDLQPLLDAEGVDGTILVQAAPTEAETDHLLGLAHRTPAIRGVIGWVDLAAADACDRIAARAGALVGIRPMLQDLRDPEWILLAVRPEVMEAVAASGLVFDALVSANQIATVAELARRHPGLAIVLDHAGKPPLGRAAAMARWQRDIAAAAACPNVDCKLSGLLTEQAPGTPPGEMDDAIAALLDLFGPDRLIWGSDWPVLTLAGSYGVWLDRVRGALAPLPAPARQAVLGGNAVRRYRLPTPAN